MSDFNDLSLYDIHCFKSGNYIVNEENDLPSLKNYTIIGEGDSWFDYPPGIDILDYLNGHFNFNVIKLGKAGDKLLRMIYGTDDKTKIKNLDNLKQLIKKKKADFFVFSGGGNDLSGEQLALFLYYCQDQNNATAGDIVKKNILDDFMNDMKSALKLMLDEFLNVNNNLKIFMHGYGYPVPDGRPVFYVLGSMPWIGPWLKPALENRGINNLSLGKEIMKIIIDEFNKMLEDIMADQKYNGKFYYINLRNIINTDDWVNELHVNNNAFLKITKSFYDEIIKFIDL